MITLLPRRYKHIKRYTQIVSTFISYGLGDVFSRLRTATITKILRRPQKISITQKKLDNPLPVRLRIACEELGTTFIKLAQMLSVRHDLIPETFIREFKKLQRTVPPFSAAKAVEIIESELRKPLKQLYASFDETPVAAASIAQVHTAKTLDGTDVVIKIQRPGIKPILDIDLEILYDLAHLLERFIPSVRIFRPVETVNDFSKYLQTELDFHHELRNIEMFREKSAQDHAVYVPAVFPELSSARVLTLEKISGIPVSETQELLDHGSDFKIISANCANAILKQIFEWGFFHGDPHPGNILIMPGNIIAFVDYGLIGYLDSELKEDLSSMFLAFIARDSDKIVRIITSTYIDDPELCDIRAFRRDMRDFINSYYAVTFSSLNIASVLYDIAAMIRKYEVRLSPDLILLIKALISSETIARTMDPDFQIIHLLRKYMKRLIKNRLNIRKNIKIFGNDAAEFFSFIRILPAEIRSILLKLKTGKLSIRFEHQGLDYLIAEMDSASNRISFSVIIAALIIGSSLIVRQYSGTGILGTPIIGLIGYIIAGILGLGLVISIIRSGKM